MARRSKDVSAAYTLIDLSDLPDDVRQDIIEDATGGGGNEYGVRVVEEAVNGPARQALFGVYKGDDADKWAAAKEELGISGSEVDDAEVTGIDTLDPRREAALRQAAIERAGAEAERIRTAEEADIAEIVGDEGEERASSVAPQLSHTANIVDDRLDREATNVVRRDGTTAEGNKPKAKTKTPR